MNSIIAVSTLNHELEVKAKSLAEKLHLPFIQDNQDYDYLLNLTLDHLELRSIHSRSLPLFVDFLSKQITYRRHHASLKNEILARALGLKGNLQPTIVDATAGLARDSFIIAGLGFEILLLERSPVIYELVADGIRRALQDPDVSPIIQRLNLIQTDAIVWLKTHKADIVYLDPMFPERQKSALVKKEMRIFKDIVGEDLDSEDLLQSALTCATKRVVVKRPRLTDPIKGSLPTFSLKGSSSRFDIYIV